MRVPKLTRHSEHHRAGKVVDWLAWWLALLAFYLVLAESVAWAEIVVGLTAAALAASAAVATQTVGGMHGRPQVAWLLPLMRIPRHAALDCGIVIKAIGTRLTGRGLEGSFRTLPFDADRDRDNSNASLRRALVILGVSIAPNTYVVGIDESRGQMLVHQLVVSKVPPGNGDRRWPL